MYRPNRIGPWQQWNANKSVWTNDASDASVIGGTGIESIFPQIESTSLDDKGQFQLIVDTILLTVGEYIAFGVPVSADFAPGSDHMQFSITGGLQFNEDGANVVRAQAWPFLAKPLSSTLVADDTAKTNESTEYIILPHVANRFGCNVNTCVIVQDTAENAIPFIAGFVMETAYASGAQLQIRANISVEKYVQDTIVYDPNR